MKWRKAMLRTRQRTLPEPGIRMPEGDTVHRAAQRLNAALAGAVLTGCDIRVPAYATVDLSGEMVHGVVSRGKHLLARVGPVTIHSHLKMEGEWRLYRHGERWSAPAFEARIVLQTADRVAVGFRLGQLDVVPREQEDALLGHLGPDLLDPEWNTEHRSEAVRRIGEHPGQPVVLALLEQRNVAGLGNEYVTELCFLRGMLPTRPVAETDVPAAVDLAHRLIVANRDRPVRTTTGELRPGRRTWVYARADEPCRRCGTRIRRLRLGRSALEQREMYFCPHCQC